VKAAGRRRGRRCWVAARPTWQTAALLLRCRSGRAQRRAHMTASVVVSLALATETIAQIARPCPAHVRALAVPQ
jgi:hypothetical protein